MKKILFMTLMLTLSFSVMFAQGVQLRKDVTSKAKTDVSVDRAAQEIKAPIPAVSSTNADKSIMLHNNGNIVTHPGGGVGGADFSWITGTTYGSNFNGANATGPYRMISNFSVTDVSWTVDSIRIYGYQTGSTTVSTITGMYIRIWNGNPSLPGAVIVYTDSTMASTRWTNCYRGDAFTATNRPIMVAVQTPTNLTLPYGTNYWIEYAMKGSTTSGPWCPPVFEPGNDLQRNGTTNPHTFTETFAEYPVDIFGTKIAASCPVVSNLNTTVVDKDNATFTWTAGGTETSWKVERGAAGFTPGTGVSVVVTSPTVNLTGLTASTTYDVLVYAICGPNDTSAASLKTITTPACYLSEFCTYTFELFDDYGDGWNNAKFELRQNGVLTHTITMASGATLTVPVTICNNAAVTLTWISGAYDEECGLTVKDHYGSVIYSFAPTFNPAANAVFFTFTAACASTCPPPAQLSVANITAFTANLNWVENGTATIWDIEWGTQGFTPGTGTMVTGVTTKPHALTGLAASTNYSFYVRANCGTELSNWSGVKNFTTDADCPVYNLPFEEGFEGTVFPPLCWKNIDADGDGHKWQIGAAPGIAPKTGTQSATSASWIPAGPLTPDNYLVTPKLAIPATGPVVLKFWVAAQDPAYPQEKYSVMVSTTGTNATDFTSIYSQTLTDSAYQEITLPLDNYFGQNIHIAFRHHDCTDWYVIKIDDVKVISTANVDLTAVASMKLYPNPTTDLVYISEKANVQIFNLHGQLVGSYKEVSQIDVTHLNAGTYFFRINTENKVHTTTINVIR